MRLELATTIVLAMTACTHAPTGDTRITCYSGGKVIMDDIATGAVVHTAPGWIEFESTTTGKRMRVAGIVWWVVTPELSRPA